MRSILLSMAVMTVVILIRGGADAQAPTKPEPSPRPAGAPQTPTLPLPAPLAPTPTPPQPPVIPPHYHLVKQIPIGGEGGWDYLAVDPITHRVFVSHGTHVVVVDPEKDELAGDIPNTPGVHGIAFAPELHRAFISCGASNEVVVISTESQMEIDRIKVGAGPDAILYDSFSGRVFTFNGAAQTATAIDVKTEQVVGDIKIGGKPEFAATDGKGKIFCNVEDKSTILAIDPVSLKILNTWPIAPGQEASGLAIDADNHRLFAVCRNGMMVIVNADSGAVVAHLPIGQYPDAAGFDPGEKCAFSSNGDGTLTVVQENDPNTFTVLDNVSTQTGARTMAVDASLHNVCLVTAKVDPTAPTTGPNARPRFLPNTLVLLVYSP